MAPHVIDENQCGGAVSWTQGSEGKIVSGIEVIDEVVGRSDHCA